MPLFCLLLFVPFIPTIPLDFLQTVSLSISLLGREYDPVCYSGQVLCLIQVDALVPDHKNLDQKQVMKD